MAIRRIECVEHKEKEVKVHVQVVSDMDRIGQLAKCFKETYPDPLSKAEEESLIAKIASDK